MKNVKVIMIVLVLGLFGMPGMPAQAKMVSYWEDDSVITVTKNVNGNTHIWTEITTGEDKKQVSKRVDTYTYFPNGQIQVISQKVYDAKDKVVSDKDITHYLDGKQPTISVNDIGEAAK